MQVAVKVLQRVDPKLLNSESAGLGSRVTRSGLIAEQTLKELAKVCAACRRQMGSEVVCPEKSCEAVRAQHGLACFVLEDTWGSQIMG